MKKEKITRRKRGKRRTRWSLRRKGRRGRRRERTMEVQSK